MADGLIPTYQIQQFSANYMHLLQAPGGELRSFCVSGTHTGKGASPVNQIGKVEMREVTTRNTPIVPQELPAARRWVYPSDFSLSVLVNQFDELRTIGDPKSKYVEACVMAADRKIDAIMAAAYFGTAYTGETGSTSVTWASLSSAQNIAVNDGASGNVGLTAEKLILAKALLRRKNVSSNTRLTCVITSYQEANLLREIRLYGEQYAPRPTFDANGNIRSWIGIDFRYYESLPYVTTSVRAVPLYDANRFYRGDWLNPSVTISQRMDLEGQPWQIYVMQSLGATRLEEEAIVQIACSEA